MTTTCLIAETTSVADWVTAIATAGAVVIASIAIVMTQRSIGRERQHQRLVERHRDMVEVLAAYETMQGLRALHYLPDAYELDLANEEIKKARARFIALVRASEEPLTITRGIYFRHIPYGADNGAEADHLKTARLEGNPESENKDVRWIRGEIIDAIDGLRGQINAR